MLACVHFIRQWLVLAVVLPASAGLLNTLSACAHQPPAASARWLQLEADTMAALRRGDFDVLLRLADLQSRLGTPAQGGRLLFGPLDGLADADQFYNATDSIIAGASSRRMMAAAVTRDAGIVFVEAGGIARRTYLVLISRSSGAVCQYAASVDLPRPSSGDDLGRHVERLKQQIQRLSAREPFFGTNTKTFESCSDANGR